MTRDLKVFMFLMIDIIIRLKRLLVITGKYCLLDGRLLLLCINLARFLSYIEHCNPES